MKVPKGTSDYQATWIVDEDEEENGETDEESSDDDDDDIMDETMAGEEEENDSQVRVNDEYDRRSNAVILDVLINSLI